MTTTFDGTTGYFNDVPYFNPVETALFYDAVQSCRLHKLPGHLMVPPRTMPFFLVGDCELAQKLGDKLETATATRTKSAAAIFPELKTEFTEAKPLFKKSGEHFILLRERCPDEEPGAGAASPRTTAISQIDAVSVSQVWSDLICFLNDCNGACSRFSIRYTDIFYAGASGYGECLLSLLLLGVASILHFFSTKPSCAAALEEVAIEFVFLNSSAGALMADRLQFHIESKLKLSVRRHIDENFACFHHKLISAARCFDCTASTWADTVCGEAVDAHEELCDQEMDASAGKFVSPVVLLVVPPLSEARTTLATQILDSYSSEPLRVQSDDNWSPDEFEKASPIVFICSSSWIVRQMSFSNEDSLLRRLDVKIVLHGGFCESKSTTEEELVCCLVALQSLEVAPHEVRIAVHEAPSFFAESPQPAARASEHTIQACGDLILLAFRRFVTRFSPESKQPFASLRRDLFFTQRSWEFLQSTVSTLRSAGLLETRADSSPETLELTVLGRVLSLRFRVGNDLRKYGALSLKDEKAVLWSFLLRQPFSALQDTIAGWHFFSSWISGAVAAFCSDYQLTLATDDGVDRRALVEQLAEFGFRDDSVPSRVHYLLSSPAGTRFSLRSHLTGTLPTVCRGWYDQAPLNAGLALEKKEVGVACVPPSALFCEMEADGDAPSLRLQCPLELSYPILVAHSVLHISLHNACVFSETAEPSSVTSLPSTLLETGVMHFLMSGLARSNSGLWLDGMMHEIAPAASDVSVLAPLALKGKRYIQHCEREAFTRKRRRAEVVPEKSNVADGFQGVHPRTVAERSAVEELVALIKSIGREKAEKVFRGKKGFNFLETSHELHPFYLYSLSH